jgi:hypothetical protein
VQGEQGRAAVLGRPRELLDPRGVVVSRAQLRGHRHAHRVGHRAHGLLQRRRIAQQRRARAARDRALRGTAEVEVDQRGARGDRVLRGPREMREVVPHQLHADRLHEARRPDVTPHDGARDRRHADPHELRERAAERRGVVAREHEIAETRLGDTLHRGEQRARGEWQHRRRGA